MRNSSGTMHWPSAPTKNRKPPSRRSCRTALWRSRCGTADMIREFAPAKVNLFLHAGTRRADGYHELESLVVFASVGDELTVEQSERLSLDVAGPFAAALA